MMAFNRLGIEVESVGFSEIDKYAIQSYRAIHGNHKSWGSIVDIKGKDLPEIDVFTYSFPCTDLSKAGKQKGLSNTRSGLVYEVLRILHELKEEERLPKVLIMENVVDLVQVKFIKQFQEIQLELEELGYSNYTETLNAKDYGVAQNRDRVFMVSILGDYYYEFPKPIKLEKRLRDYLETNVDKKYRLSDRMLQGMMKTNFNSYQLENRLQDLDGCISTILTRYEGSPQVVDHTKINVIGNYMPSNHDASRIVHSDGLAPAVKENHGTITATNEPCLIIPENTEKGYAIAEEGDGVYTNRPHQKRGVVQKGMIQTIKANNSDIGVVVSESLTPNYIFDLCAIIDENEVQKYEDSRKLLQILWEEIRKKEIWEEVGRFWSIQEENLLRQDVYEERLLEDRNTQPKLCQFTHDSKIDKSVNIEKRSLRNMWECFKFRYSSSRWELSQQQFDELNLLMSKLPQQTTQNEKEMCYMWGLSERTRVLQQTLYSLQKIWGSIIHKKQNEGLIIRKLSPLEVWRLMGIDDEDFHKAQKSGVPNSQLYKQAGNGIVVDVFAAIIKTMTKGEQND